MSPQTTHSTTLRSKIEQDVVNELVTRLEHHEISLERVAQIARFILAQLPENLTDEETLQLIPTLDDGFTELAVVVNNALSEYAKNNHIKPPHNPQNDIQTDQLTNTSKLVRAYLDKKTPTET